MFIKRHIVSTFLLAFIVTLHHNAAAQPIDKTLEKKEEQDLTVPIRSAFKKDKTDEDLQKKQLFEPEPDVQSLEAPIDPESYIVGPGDVFVINVWTSLEANFKVAVNPLGQLVIPTIGTLDVDGKTLAQVQEMVKIAGAKKYLNSTITAGLVYLRTIRVHVTGQVIKPGLYEALPVDRVSDIIEEAQGLTNWAAERAIEVRHRDGSMDTVDLYQYAKHGNLDANIYVKAGDVIHVPPIKFENATVRVEGVVNDPGVYQLVENEKLEDFLLRVDAFNKSAELRGAYIRRNTMSNGGTETIPIFPYLKKQGNGLADLTLQDGDVIMVPQRQGEVYVVGAVRMPGPYAYYPNLKAVDYVGFAGSTEKATGLSKVKVRRKDTEEEIDDENVIVEPGDIVIVPQKTEFGVREVTQIVGTITSILLTMKAIDVIE